MLNKIQTDAGRLHLVLKMTKSSSLAKSIEKFIFIIKTKSSLSTSVFILSTISQILKTKFYVFWKQTCRNLKSIEFASFLTIRCSEKFDYLVITHSEKTFIKIQKFVCLPYFS